MKIHKKKSFHIAAWVLCSLLFYRPGYGESNPKLSFAGESLWRYEMWDWFTPTRPQDYRYGYFFNRSRASLKSSSPLVDGFIQLQYTQIFDLPGAGSVAASPQGPLGLGPIYFANTGERFPYKIFLKQVFADIKNPFGLGLSARIGRFDYSDGAESLSGDARTDWVIKTRVAERLLGPFGFSAFTRSFDGAWAWFDQPAFRLDQLISHPTQGGFEESAGNTMEKVDVLNSTLTIKRDKLLPKTRERFFFMRYVDQRAVTQRVDNSGIGSAPKVNITVDTYGFDFAGANTVGKGQADWLFWTALQGGDWYELNHRAFAWDVEAGYQWNELWAKPWLRVGFFDGSGDNNPGDTVHQTFFQVLPTGRQYAFFPLYNLMNNQDLFVQSFFKPHPAVTVNGNWHFLALDAKQDRLYGGSGAGQEKGGNFGYVGRNAFGKSEVGNLLDCTVTYEVSNRLRTSAYYGHIFGGNVLEKIYPKGDDANFFFVEMAIKI